MNRFVAALALPLAFAAQTAGAASAASGLAFVGQPYPHYTIHHGESIPPLQIKAIDFSGNAVPNAKVDFTVTGNCGGSFAGASTYEATTDPDGVASTIAFAAGTGTGWCLVIPTLPGVLIDVPLSFAIAVYEVSDLSVAPTSAMPLNVHVGSTFAASAYVVFQSAPFLRFPAQWSVVPAASGASATLVSHDNASGADVATFNANGIGGDYKIVARIGDSSVEIPVVQRGDPVALDYQGDFTMAPSSSAQYAGYVRDQFGLGVPGVSVTERWLCDSSACGTASDSITDGEGRSVVTVGVSPVPGDFQLRSEVNGGKLQRTVNIHVVAGAPPAAVAVPSVQDMWWSGSRENGWGMSVVQHGEKLFAVVYAYDANGKPTWYVLPSGTWDAGRKAYTGALYSPSGSPFYAYDASRLVVNGAGSMMLDFDQPVATMQYDVQGSDGGKFLERQPFDTALPAPRSGLGDMWWGGPAQNGWGIAILQDHANLFGVWFTYDANGAPTWFVMPAGSWTSPDTYEGRLYRTTGSQWAGHLYDAAQLKAFDVGPFRLRFTGDTATFDYMVEARTGTLQLERQGF